MTNEQYQDFLTNQLPHFSILKKELGEAISTLYDARTKLYECIMFHDLLKTKMMVKTISKPQIENLIKHSKVGNHNLTYDQIYDIKSKDIVVEKKANLPNPKVFAKAAVHQLERPELPTFVSEEYKTTIYTLSEK